MGYKTMLQWHQNFLCPCLTKTICTLRPYILMLFHIITHIKNRLFKYVVITSEQSMDHPVFYE